GGGFMTFHDDARLSFEVSGLLAIRRIGFGTDITDSVTYVEAPVLARYSAMSSGNVRVRAIGGVVPAFLLRASENDDGVHFSATDAYKSLDVAIAVGAQAEWKKRWVFEGRYLISLVDVYEFQAGSERTRQRGLQILVGYRLR